jgi:hypothetical protein
LDFISGDVNKHIGPTNADFLKSGDPRSTSYSLGYIYDNFEWDHCVDNDFQALLGGDGFAISNSKDGNPDVTGDGPPVSKNTETKTKKVALPTGALSN